MSIEEKMLKLPVDLFFHCIKYLSFGDVISLCSCNKKLRDYGSDPRFSIRWKSLIDQTYSDVYDYSPLISENNYLMYVRLINRLDPISRLMIYYRQGDFKSFHNQRYTKIQRFLSLFLLNKQDEMINSFPDISVPQNKVYLLFINIKYGRAVSQYDLNKMLAEMVEQGNMRGLLSLKEEGANIHFENDYPLRLASECGHLPVVKYLTEQGANVASLNYRALRLASMNGHLAIVQFLVKQGHIDANNEALILASGNGHLELVKFLVNNGANIHAEDDEALQSASMNGHLAIVKYLVECGANIEMIDSGVMGIVMMRKHYAIASYLKGRQSTGCVIL